MGPHRGIASPTPTMSSREIAELTGKRHDNIMRDIKAMLLELDPNGTGLSFEVSYRDSTGRSLPCYALPKRETLILVSGYSVPLRARIIDRWQELEAKQSTQAVPALPNFLDPVEAARAWALAYEGVLGWAEFSAEDLGLGPVHSVGLFSRPNGHQLQQQGPDSKKPQSFR